MKNLILYIIFLNKNEENLMNTKLKQVIESMHQENIDSMIVLKPENIRYLTGFRPSSSSILILKDNPVLLASKIDREDASGNSLVNLEIYKEFKDVKNYLEGKIGIENSMNIETYKKLTEDFELNNRYCRNFKSC